MTDYYTHTFLVGSSESETRVCERNVGKYIVVTADGENKYLNK